MKVKEPVVEKGEVACSFPEEAKLGRDDQVEEKAAVVKPLQHAQHLLQNRQHFFNFDYQ